MDEERFEPQGDDEPIVLTPSEREDIAADLEDLSAMRVVFQAQGVKGVVISCQDCGENHFYEWELLRDNLDHMLQTGEPRMHEPAFSLVEDEYIQWDYGKGYIDALTETGLQPDRRIEVTQCPWCETAFLGMVGRDALAPAHGAFAPRIAIGAARLVPVAAGLTNEQAAIVEPATVALHAVRRSPPHLGDVVAVQGCGPIGLLTLQCAKAAGAGRVVAIEPDPARRELATMLGADVAVGPDDALDALGAGADLVLECAGVPATVQRAVELVRRGGTVNLVGLASGTAAIAPGVWLVKEVTVVASLGYLHHEFGECMDLIADGRVQVTPLHDRTVGLTELPAAIARLADDPSSAVKVLVDPRR